MSEQTEIAIVAFEKWKQRGCPEGSAEQDWTAAEQQLAETVLLGETHSAPESKLSESTKELDDLSIAK